MRAATLGMLAILASCGGTSAGNEAAADGPSASNEVSKTVPDTDADGLPPVDNAAAEAPTPADQPSNNDVQPAAAAGEALPPEVAAFKARRNECDHFRGEDAEDEPRAAELEKALNRTCKGTDAALASLRKRYAGNAAVIAALAEYDSEIE